jgi:type VI secretion system secreted protein VgrG
MNDQMSGDASSAVDYADENRFLRITSPLGAGALLLTEVNGTDHISTPFLFQIEFVTKQSDSAVLTLLGQPVTLFLANTQQLPGGRPVNGLIRKLSGPTNYIRGFKRWRAELVPQLAFLGYTADSRIFQNQSVVQIIEDIFQIHGLINYRIGTLIGRYKALEYCVQYRETALNFVSRLMENFGLYYWHEHTDDTHVLVIADTMTAAGLAAAEPLETVDVDQYGAIHSIESDYAFRPGLWTLKDYYFEAPDAPLLASAPTVINDPRMNQYEVFDYPGGYSDASLGTSLSRARIEQEESQYHRLTGAGSCATFDSGHRFEVYAIETSSTGAAEEVLLNNFLLEVRHHASDLTYVTLDAAAPRYSNAFAALPMNVVFRPERITRRPFVQGPQTAIVTGPAGEQIYTDEYGRVKVRFHWDRNPGDDPDEQSSCWLRVSQLWANGRWGGIHIPRIGEEVIVDFIEGDPDRPIITGRVYNADNQVPYALPANKTQSGIKSQSVPSGGSNEFRFEDKQGSEEVWLHAQKDFNYKVENDETATILGNETRNVSGTLSETVTGAVSETYQDTLTQKVTNSITVTCPVVTFNVNTAMTINTPSTTEAKNSDLTAGAYKLSCYGVGMNAYAVYMNVYALKMDLTGLKIDLALMAIKNAPLEFECVKAKIKVVDSWIKTAATKIESAATYIKDGAMYAITYAVVMIP